MTWEEIQAAIPEGNSRPRARRKAWMDGQYIYRGGFPLFLLNNGHIDKKRYPGFAKKVNNNPHLCIDTWMPTEEDKAATDWELL